MAGKRRHRELIRNLPAVIPQPEPEEERDRFGNASKFKREYIEQARVLCEDGATDKELADFFGVDRQTINNWRLMHPAFAKVCKLGKDLANDRLERTAYELAMGYTTTVKEMVKLRDNQGNEIIKFVQKEVVIPPDRDMVRWMLKNRRPDDWRDKVEQVHSGEVVHLTLEQARERLAARLQDIKSRQLGTSQTGEG